MTDRTGTSFEQVPAQPYSWPFDGRWSATDTALMLLGFQKGTIADLSAQSTLETALEIQAIASKLEMTVIATRRGIRSPGNAIADRRNILGDRIFRTDSDEWQLAEQLRLQEELVVVDHAGDNGFHQTELENILRALGVRNLLIAGLPTDGLVHATQRAANDMGFECLAIADACKGTSESRHEAQLRITTFGNGLFGAVASSGQVRSALKNNLRS